jgi:hypothetical protein
LPEVKVSQKRTATDLVESGVPDLQRLSDFVEVTSVEVDLQVGLAWGAFNLPVLDGIHLAGHNQYSE